MVEMVEILDGRLGKRSVELVRYVINNLLHLVIVKYGDISLVLCISTRLRLMTILSLLVKYLVIFHADPCNKSYDVVGMSVVCQITWNHVNQTRACSKSVFFFEKRSLMMMMIDNVVMIIMFINTSFMECLLWLKAGFSRHQVYW